MPQARCAKRGKAPGKCDAASRCAVSHGRTGSLAHLMRCLDGMRRVLCRPERLNAPHVRFHAPANCYAARDNAMRRGTASRLRVQSHALGDRIARWDTAPCTMRARCCASLGPIGGVYFATQCQRQRADGWRSRAGKRQERRRCADSTKKRGKGIPFPRDGVGYLPHALAAKVQRRGHDHGGQRDQRDGHGSRQTALPGGGGGAVG